MSNFAKITAHNERRFKINEEAFSFFQTDELGHSSENVER